MTGKRRRTIFLVSSALIATLALGACGAADSHSSSGSGAADRAVAPEQAQGQAPDQAQAGGGADKQAPNEQAPNTSVDQRSIIYTGSLSVRTKDVTAAAGQAEGIATTAGGFVGSDQRSSGSGEASATMTLRVPAGKFQDVVEQLSKLGTEESRKISTEDVTEDTIDLNARIAVQQARVDAANRLLAQAKSLSDLLMLEKEVASRESDLASLQAKQRHMADLVTLSTITVTLLSPTAVVAPPKEEGPPGFLGGLAAGWHGFLATLAVILTVLGAILPFLLIVVPLVWLIVVARRRGWLRRALGPPAPVVAGAPSGSFPGPATAYGARHPGWTGVQYPQPYPQGQVSAPPVQAPHDPAAAQVSTPTAGQHPAAASPPDPAAAQSPAPPSAPESAAPDSAPPADDAAGAERPGDEGPVDEAEPGTARPHKDE